ncbi:hypothetical protein CONPUDRAFT_116205 [Coniophora puteana RWD-64-598 SS2]|uniref:S-adenosyl-L-methionine-dependent methyltransferase n=1 Tax=Coniophora puteana (strain RWD-64-598) TaxID=741705 RepID=A0A5M3N729_CONPW|nr:uncharacterized protein CONPUDRAFT_116205 [Coniophora puteana RWD-64-598 SS2]EIW87126.1 hypothetical protein CONPUDRAFT_116205 [Coniophora puteana RWD-64-598 SS2]
MDDQLDEDSQCFSLLLGYSSLVPPSKLSWPSEVSFSQVHSFLLNRILLDPHLTSYPPSERYQQSFWKWVIKNVEAMDRSDEDDELDERIYNHHLSLLSHDSSGPPPQSYVTSYWKGPAFQLSLRTATLLESRTTIEGGTTGLRTWKASYALSSFLLKRPGLVAGKHVLELGCGTGLLGIIVAGIQQFAGDVSADGSQLWLTDISDLVLERSSNNVQLPCNTSSIHPNVRYASLNWSDALEKEGAASLTSLLETINPDMILGADLVFDPSLVSPLAAVLSLALSVKTGSSRSKEAFIALTIRNEQTLAYFLEVVGEKLHCEELHLDDAGSSTILTGAMESDLDNSQDVKIFKITKGSRPP